MLFYIDYLDHITSRAVSVKMLALRLRYDLLIFADDTMCMSVPSCVKLKETTDLLMDLDDFWSAGKICLQLDKKHRKDPMRYFANRKKVLEKGMPEEMLVRHFEYVAYESSRVGDFFNLYIPEVVKNPKRTLYIGKEHDTDLLFRTASAKIFSKHCDTVCSILDTKRAIEFAGIANRVQTYAFDKSLLFHRGVIEDAINDEYRPRKNEKAIVATLLDRAFALANAQTSKAAPLSLVTNQLTGRWLMHLLFKTYRQLYNLIAQLDWHEVFALSHNTDWRRFIETINAYIYLIQDSTLKKYDIPIEYCINKLSSDMFRFSLIIDIKNSAIDAVESKLFEQGVYSNAQDMQEILTLCTDTYCGKHASLLTALRAIDYYANRIAKQLSEGIRYDYLQVDADMQKRKGYQVLE